MSDSPGIVRELGVRFGIEIDPSATKKADDFMDGLIGKLKGFAALAAVIKLGSAIGDLVKDVVKEADELNDAAERIGTTTEALQGLGYAADISGSSAADMMQGVKFLTKTIGEAGDGSNTANKAFKDLGVSFKNADGSLKNPATLLPEIADALKKVENPTKRAALSMGVFSRAGQALAPFLAKGSDEIARLTSEFSELGGVFDESMVTQSAEAVDNVDRFHVILKSIGQAFAKAILPVFNRINAKFQAWWKEDGPKVRQVIENITSALTGLFENIVQLLDPIWYVLGQIIAGWDGIAGIIGGWLPLLAIAAGLVLAIFAPWVLIGAAIALVAEDIYQFATGGESVIGWLFMKAIEYVTQFYEKAVKLIYDIGDSVWALGENVVNYLSAAFDNALGYVTDIANKVVGVFTNAFDKITGMFSNIGGSLGSIGATLGITGPASTVPFSGTGASGGGMVKADNTVQINLNTLPGQQIDKSLIEESVSQAEDMLSTYNATLGYAQ